MTCSSGGPSPSSSRVRRVATGFGAGRNLLMESAMLELKRSLNGNEDVIRVPLITPIGVRGQVPQGWASKAEGPAVGPGFRSRAAEPARPGAASPEAIVARGWHCRCDRTESEPSLAKVRWMSKTGRTPRTTMSRAFGEVESLTPAGSGAGDAIIGGIISGLRPGDRANSVRPP
jgi:hypothetical protein